MGSIGEGSPPKSGRTPAPRQPSLTGETAQQFADDSESSTGKQWTSLPCHGVPVVAHAMKRTRTRIPTTTSWTALKATNLDTLAGDLNFSSGGASNPVPNVATTPLAGGQWIEGEVPMT